MINNSFANSLHLHGEAPQDAVPYSWGLSEDSAVEPRNWQAEAVEYFQKANKPNTFVVAPCGSGKSKLQVFLATKEIIDTNYKQKQVIVVPQGHIGQSFVGDSKAFMKVKINGKEYIWLVENNFCELSREKLNKLKKFLLSDSFPRIEGRVGATVCVTTHHALAAIWKKLNKHEKSKAIQNTSFRFDESHRVKGIVSEEAFVEDEYEEENERTEEKKLSNQLGAIGTYIMNAPAKSKSSLHLMTATPYRGDRESIIVQEMRNKMAVYTLSFYDNFIKLGIKRFLLGFWSYTGNNPANAIVENIMQEPDKKHLIIVPRTLTGWRTNNEDWKIILNKLIKAGFKKDRILDLVTEETQKINKKLLLAEPKTKCEDSKYDIIISCMLTREGTDWCPADRLHNTCVERSPTQLIQTAGRVFRRFEGKKEVSLKYYVGNLHNIKDKKVTIREILSDRHNCILLLMSFDDEMSNLLLPVIPKGNQEKNRKVSSQELFPHGVNKEILDRFIARLGFIESPTEKQIDDILLELHEEYKDMQSDSYEPILLEDFQAYFKTLYARRIMANNAKMNDAETIRRIQGINIEFIRTKGKFDKIIKSCDGKNIFFSATDTEEDIKIVSEKYKEYANLFIRQTHPHFFQGADQWAQYSGIGK